MKLYFLILSLTFFGSLSFAQKIITVKVDTSKRVKTTIYNKHPKNSSKFIIDVPGKLPMLSTIQLRNCSKEMRTSTFNSQMNFFKRWTYGLGKLNDQKVLFFLPTYKIDSNYLNANFLKIRHALPINFDRLAEREDWYDNEPNKDSIWFIQIFGKIDRNFSFNIYAAYKITFEGTDARIDEQRREPKIKNIEFIYEKEKLLLLEAQLKHASKSF